jgi:hypothetical protein
VKTGLLGYSIYLGLYQLWVFAMFPEDTRDLWDHVHVNVLAPEYIEMLVSPEAANVEAVFGKLMAHRINVHKRIDVTIEKDNAGCNVAGGEFGWTITRTGAMFTGPERGSVHVVVVHDEPTGAHDLEPVYDGLCASKGIKMGIGREFLCGGDVMGVPGEQKAERGVDEVAKDRWIENMLPHEGGGEDGTTAKYEEKESRTDGGSKRVSASRVDGM